MSYYCSSYSAVSSDLKSAPSVCVWVYLFVCFCVCVLACMSESWIGSFSMFTLSCLGQMYKLHIWRGEQYFHCLQEVEDSFSHPDDSLRNENVA